MLVMHAPAELGVAAHGIHYAITGVGVLGLVALLTPQLLAPTRPRDEHEARVHALRTALARTDRGLPGPATGNLSATACDPTQVASQENWLHRAPGLTTAQRALLPLAVVSSAAAAGTHAAVAPQHFEEPVPLGAGIGAFFVGATLAQLLWAGLATVRCSRPLLVAGVLGNLAVIGLWSVTRTLGLPFGLLSGPEAVGPWDLACVAWELVVVCSGIAILQSCDPEPTRLVGWRHWHATLPTYVAGSVLLLLGLSLSGAGA